MYRPSSYVEDRSRDSVGTNSSPLVQLDDAAHSHIDKHRYLHSELYFIAVLNYVDDLLRKSLQFTLVYAFTVCLKGHIYCFYGVLQNGKFTIRLFHWLGARGQGD